MDNNQNASKILGEIQDEIERVYKLQIQFIERLRITLREPIPVMKCGTVPGSIKFVEDDSPAERCSDCPNILEDEVGCLCHECLGKLANL